MISDTYDAVLESTPGLHEQTVETCYRSIVIPTLHQLVDAYNTSDTYNSPRAPQDRHFELLEKVWWEGDLVVENRDLAQGRDKVWFRFTCSIPFQLPEDYSPRLTAYALFSNHDVQTLKEAWPIDHVSESQIKDFVERALALKEEAKKTGTSYCNC